jgi:Cell division protein CrgA
VPKSKVRKKPDYAGAGAGVLGSSAGNKVKPSPSWYPIVMGVLLILGLAYIVVYYLASDRIGFMNSLGSWNFAIGFGFLIVGLGMAVRWR